MTYDCHDAVMADIIMTELRYTASYHMSTYDIICNNRFMYVYEYQMTRS